MPAFKVSLAHDDQLTLTGQYDWGTDRVLRLRHTFGAYV